MLQGSESPTSIRPYSRPAALAKMDGRTREAKMMREARAELTAHVGGKPSATQRALIEQAVQLRLRLAVMDQAFAQAGGTMTDHSSRSYLAWANSYSRLLRQLGLRGPAERSPSLADYLAGRGAPGGAVAIGGHLPAGDAAEPPGASLQPADGHDPAVAA